MSLTLPKLGSLHDADPAFPSCHLHEKGRSLQEEPAATSSASSIDEDDKQMVCSVLAHTPGALCLNTVFEGGLWLQISARSTMALARVFRGFFLCDVGLAFAIGLYPSTCVAWLTRVLASQELSRCNRTYTVTRGLRGNNHARPPLTILVNQRGTIFLGVLAGGPAAAWSVCACYYQPLSPRNRYPTPQHYETPRLVI